MCYIRNVAQQSAVNLFNEWIRTAPGLEQRLLAMGRTPPPPVYPRASAADGECFRRTLKGSSGKLPKRCGCNCRCDSLRFSVTLGNSLQFSAIPCNSLQSSATPCNPLQLSAIPCNPP